MDKQKITYQIIRCKRKSTALYVKEGGEVVVRAPLFVSDKQIDAFVQSHDRWILQKQKEQQALQVQKEQFSVTNNSILTVLGKAYPVSYGSQVHFDGAVFEIPKGSFLQVKPQIIAEYQRLAKKVITERVNYFSQVTGWKAEGVKIGSAKTRWGSCSGKNRLNFTWKLIFADLDTIDYVVLHELAHTREHNHSKRFWNLVAQHMPDYQERRACLSMVQQKLMAENWD